ncbi:MAG: FAD-binding protein [Bacillota bacterium]
MYDVIIVGAGPAGSTLARLISTNYKVLLVDKRFGPSSTAPSKKCCGGLLAPDAQNILGTLGLALPRDILVGPQIFKVRAIDLQAGLDKYYQRFYINMDRNKFDHWLISLLPHSVETRFGKHLTEIEKGDSFRIQLNGENSLEELECKVLVGADGAVSSVRRQLFPYSANPHRYLAIQEWFLTSDVMPYFSAIFEPSITDFYSWIIPKENCLLLGAALPPGKDAYQKFSRLKQKLNHYGFNLEDSIKRESAPVLRPTRSGEILMGSNRVLLIGEAAGLISPSSAEGLSYAFTSALLASRSLKEGLINPAARYQKMARPLYRNINHKLIKSSLMYFAPSRRAIMASGFFTMNVENTW